jgi:LmbE family N-acetylglucosaminyl deacetylase
MKDLIRRFRVLLLRIISRIFAFRLSVDGENVLILAPHPDDEVIGCGGLIARLCALGNPPRVIILSGGGKSHNGCCSIPEKDIIQARQTLTSNAAKVMSMPEPNIYHLNFMDGNINADDSEMLKLKNLIAEIKPDTIFVPHSGEGWPDHLAVREIGLANAPEKTHVYEYCVWMWYYNVWNLDWKNAFQLKMTKTEHSMKLEAMNQYISPLAPCGKPWSGVLPKVFIRANQWNRELYFKVR